MRRLVRGDGECAGSWKSVAYDPAAYEFASWKTQRASFEYKIEGVRAQCRRCRAQLVGNLFSIN